MGGEKTESPKKENHPLWYIVILFSLMGFCVFCGLVTLKSPDYSKPDEIDSEKVIDITESTFTSKPSDTPFISDTPSPTYTQAKTPTPSPIGYAVVMPVNVNIRSGPSLEFEVIDEAKKGDELPIFTITEDGEWLSLNWINDKWVSSSIVELSLNEEDIPIAPTTSPTPTLEPTATITKTPIPKTAGHSDWIEYEDTKVGVREISWNSWLGYFRPEKGKIYYSIYIIAINLSDKTVNFNPYDFSVVDGGGEIHSQVIFAKIEPDFDSCTVRQGGVCEGWWTTFIWDRPEVKKNLIIKYEPSWFSESMETSIYP